MWRSLVPSARAVGGGAVGGAAHLALVLALQGAFGVAGPPTTGPVAVASATYLLAGAVLVGALPAALLVDRRLVAPATAVVGVLAFVAYQTWRLVQSAVVVTPGTWFDLYVAGWPAVLAVVVVLAAVERSVGHEEAEPG